MKKYRVYATFTASKYLGEFEAETKEQAEEMASESDANYASLCHQCSNEVELNDSAASEFYVEEAD
jgi:hypothetical protein